MTFLASQTIRLACPAYDDPRILHELTMRPATIADVPAIVKGVTPEETAIQFAARLCDVPPETIRNLDAADAVRVGEALNRQMLSAAFLRSTPSL